MNKFTIISGKTSEVLAKKLAEKLGANLLKTQLRVFEDGESKITIKGRLEKNKIIVIQSTYPPVDENLIQLLSIISKAKEIGTEVITVIPYMGYARQDKEFLPGEIITMKVIANLLKSVGTSKIIVVDIHSAIGLNYFNIKTQNVSAIPNLAKYFLKIKLKNPLVVSPDQGGKHRAKEFAKFLKTDFISLVKIRNRRTGKVEIKYTKFNEIIGRDLILVDDMISTGGSIIKATKFLKKQKCNRIFVACTHALLRNSAEKKIKKAGVTKIISTITIPGKTSIVDVSDVIVKAIL
ncbi:MAG: ribose-phosphate pyrophosphokinase [Nitrosarchaeum sp.]|nr:ribose-phosphate pyrophosphokinase [Nitrosarchaeum sp.]MBP0119495.1 ribose-phosphate pyrophosphokinase [Nitrosarchaeum sp.]MBP0134728.1 ribose-phosphate pyrophosphokinase [Nitrosarchaeum sp.]